MIGRLGLRLGMSAMGVGIASLMARKVFSTPSRMTAAGLVPGDTSMFSTKNCLKLAGNLERTAVLDEDLVLYFMVAPRVSFGVRKLVMPRGVAPGLAAPSFFLAAAARAVRLRSR